MNLLGIERAAYGLGLGLVGVWLVATVPGRLAARQQVAAFDAAVEVNTANWSPQRIAAYSASRTAPSPPPIAILRIPRLNLAVPVLDGVDDPVLDRGVGHIPETALPGEDGNVAIAGHRDGFFRGLKDIRPGDAIELATLDGSQNYLVERTWVVDPDDLSVLDATEAPSITLVTCYPFYYVGSAPRRFIVRGVRHSKTQRPEEER